MTVSGLSAEQIAALELMSTALKPHRWVLIGASAIQCHLPMPRLTADVDFFVAASGEAVFERLSAAGWVRDRNLLQRWRQERVAVDVVPVSDEDLLAGVLYLDDGIE